MDRENLLTDPVVYGSFAVFKMDNEWWKLTEEIRLKSGW
jgi:hypothetical protein